MHYVKYDVKCTTSNIAFCKCHYIITHDLCINFDVPFTDCVFLGVECSIRMLFVVPYDVFIIITLTDCWWLLQLGRYFRCAQYYYCCVECRLEYMCIPSWLEEYSELQEPPQLVSVIIIKTS
jgi:hypothetical protein